MIFSLNLMVIGDVNDIPTALLAGEVEETNGGLWVWIITPFEFTPLILLTSIVLGKIL